MASERQVIDIPLSAGLNTKADSKAMQSPGLAVATDIQFDDLGGIQTRPQFQAITDAAGNTISQIRKLATYRDELLAFSKDKLWSYSSGDGLWVDKGDYLAVKVAESPKFVTTGEQYNADRAEFGGVVFYTWSEDTPTGTRSYVAAVDALSGAVKLPPEALSVGGIRPRLITSKNRIVLVYTGGTASIVVRVYNASDLTYSTSTTISTVTSFDICLGADSEEVLIIATATTSYKTWAISELSVLTSIVNRTTTVQLPVSISWDNATDNRMLVCYNNGATIIADIYDAIGGNVVLDVGVGTAIGAPFQISTEFNGVDSFTVFWSAGETADGLGLSFSSETNTVTTAGSTGTEALLMNRVGLASQCFYHDGSAYIWAVYAGESSGDIVAQLQNTYFLLRSDGVVVAKSVAMQAGGFSVLKGSLPGVARIATNTFVWVGGQRRTIPLGGGARGYSARSVQDIETVFDSDEARRSKQLGETLYISGGIVSQYDGSQVVECGFNVFPTDTASIPGLTGVLNGTYNWKSGFSWTNAQGELERSTTASIYDGAMSSDIADLTAAPLHVTVKSGVVAEFWRQVAAADYGAPFFLVSSKDPASSAPNQYVESNPLVTTLTAITDNMTDAVLITKEPHPENGGLTIESLPPPPATVIAATQDRILLAGIPANPNRVVYSRLREQGEIASFHDALFVDLPADGGKITAIAFLGENLIVFKESAVYSLPGDGLNNNGQGNNYGPGRILTSDVGAVNQESVALTPSGLVFKSSKGWYILTYSWQAQYIGAAVEDFDAESIVSVLVMESQHQVRILTGSRTIVWDYLANQWSEWSVFGDDAVIWNGTHHIVDSTETSLLAQATSHTGAGDLPMLDIETAWIKLGGLQGYKLVRRLLILGEYLGAHDLRVRVAYNYNTAWIDDKSWTVSPTIVNGPLQVQHGPSRPKCQAIKFRITAEEVGDVGSPPVSEALNLTTLSLEVALKQGSFRGLGAAQKQ